MVPRIVLRVLLENGGKRNSMTGLATELFVKEGRAVALRNHPAPERSQPQLAG